MKNVYQKREKVWIYSVCLLEVVFQMIKYLLFLIQLRGWVMLIYSVRMLLSFWFSVRTWVSLLSKFVEKWIEEEDPVVVFFSALAVLS